MSRQRIGDVAVTLLNYVEDNKTFQAQEVVTVPTAIYTDPDQQRAEIDRIFKRVPLMLALSCELPAPGDYKAMEVVDLPILITRDKTSTPHAFLNVCAHRWAPIAAEGYGNRLRFTCPFHGWTYGADGRLIAIADQAKFGEIDKSSHGLKELPCEERQGMIFVCLTPGVSLDLDGYYGALLEEYAHAGLKDWTFLGGRVVEGANWKMTLNNFFESYHFGTLHAKTVAKELVSDVSHYEGFGPNMRIGLSQHSIATLREVPRTQWGEREGQGYGFIRIFFPNVTGYVGSAQDLSLFTQTFPGPIPSQSRTMFLFLRKDPPKDADERVKLEQMINSSCDVDQEDFGSGIQVQKALKSGAHEGLLYGRNERGNQYFHEWRNWFLHGNSTTPKPVM
jgi:phenylpropionate dioxygenase-like ring-hydroxylating dioxygenase large terminal subunit